jgi:hypothetical protein
VELRFKLELLGTRANAVKILIKAKSRGVSVRFVSTSGLL